MYKLYLSIIKLFLNKEYYNKYNNSIDYKYIKEYLPELNKLYLTLNKVYTDFPEKTTVTHDDLEIYFYTFYPASKQETFQPLFKALADCVDLGGDDAVVGYLKAISNKEAASRFVDLAVSYVEGGVSDSHFNEALAKLHEAFSLSLQKSESSAESSFIEFSDKLEEEVRGEPGFRWSLPSLNESLGSIRKGDFGFIVARPETGKTTFLANQVANFCVQTKPLSGGSILWINNEERSLKVALRVKQAFNSLKSTSKESALFDQELLNNVQIPKDLVLQRREVEQLCEKHQPRLIVIDQLDKIKGFDGDRYDLELKAAYSWARELAAKYGPVIGVCQASNSGEGKKWIGMGDVDSSKTGKQGEADWILGIGRSDNEDSTFVRYFFLSKNKLLGDQDTDPARRHDKWTVKILPDQAIYEDF
jgi:hypothetical protein